MQTLADTLGCSSAATSCHLQISEFREGGASKAETRIAIFGFEGTQQELKVGLAWHGMWG